MTRDKNNLSDGGLNDAILQACYSLQVLGASSARDAAEITAGRKLTDKEWEEFGPGWKRHWEATEKPASEVKDRYVELDGLGPYFSLERQIDVLRQLESWLSWDELNREKLHEALREVCDHFLKMRTWGQFLSSLNFDKNLQKQIVDDFVSSGSSAANDNQQSLAWAFRLLALNVGSLRIYGPTAIFEETKKLMGTYFDFDGLQFKKQPELPEAQAKSVHKQPVERSREARLREVKFLESEGLITTEEAAAKRHSILEEI